jgi:predicted DNA-binding transcriptional regulator AlpA
MKLKTQAGDLHVQENAAKTAQMGQPIRMLRVGQIREIVPISRSTLWRWCRAKTFPQPIRLNNSRFWRSDQVAAWIEKHSMKVER